MINPVPLGCSSALIRKVLPRYWNVLAGNDEEPEDCEAFFPIMLCYQTVGKRKVNYVKKTI